MRDFLGGDIRERTGGIGLHGIVQILFGQALGPNAKPSIGAKDIRGAIEADLGLFG